MFAEFGINAGYVEDLYTRWMQSPQSVDEVWRRFFETPRPDAPSPGGAPRTGPVAPTNGNGVAAAHANGVAQAAASYREAMRDSVIAATELQSRVAHLVNAYRDRG